MRTGQAHGKMRLLSEEANFLTGFVLELKQLSLKQFDLAYVDFMLHCLDENSLYINYQILNLSVIGNILFFDYFH